MSECERERERERERVVQNSKKWGKADVMINKRTIDEQIINFTHGDGCVFGCVFVSVCVANNDTMNLQ